MNSQPEHKTEEDVDHSVKRLKTLKAAVMGGIDEEKDKKARIIQRAYLNYLYRPVRLHRLNLIQRLTFEHSLRRGVLRLVNTVSLFLLLVLALGLSDDTTKKADLHSSLVDTFDFQALKKINSLPALFSASTSIAVSSRRFFPLSSQIFKQEHSATELLSEVQKFSGPVQLSAVADKIYVDVAPFSMTAWIRKDAAFERGIILGKRSVQSAQLFCWAWSTEKYSHSLVYGGHDLAETPPILQEPSEEHGEKNMHVEVRSPEQQDADDESALHLMALVVNATGDGVRFYRDRVLLGEMPLPRPVTDCYHPTGILVGDAGLTLGQVRYYPLALEMHHIEEIFNTGSLLVDIATASFPIPLPNIANSSVEPEENINVQDGGLAEVLSRINVDSATESSPPQVVGHPQGQLARANATTLFDPIAEREYYSIIDKPAFLDKPSSEEIPRYYNASTFPSFNGTGASFTFWYKHTPPGSTALGGYYLIGRQPSMDLALMCWSLWMQDGGFYMWSATDTLTSAIDFVPEADFPSSLFWRHIAFVLDVDSDLVRFYLDGVLAVEVPLKIPVRELDNCPENTVTALGHRFPGWTHGGEVHIADMRMYIGGPLTAQAIHSLAFNPVEGVEDGCLMELQPDSNGWRDMYLNSCSWYNAQKQINPNVCSYPGVKTACPVTCGDAQMCFTTLRTSPTPQYHLYDRIRLLEMDLQAGGSLCLNSDLSKDQLIAQCREWVSSGGTADPEYLDTYEWQLSFGGSRVNLTDCEQMEKAVKDDCSFSSQEMRRFTTDMKSNGGDYTMVFWAKISGTRSLDSRGKFLPQIAFYSNLTDPKSGPVPRVLLMANCELGDDCGANWELYSTCSPGFENIGIPEISSMSAGEWTMFSIARSNVTSKNRGSLNSQALQESTSSWSQCVEEDMFFSAFEVNQEMHMSPITLIPRFLSTATLQRIFYHQMPEMRLRAGPVFPTWVPKVSEDLDNGANNSFHKRGFTPKMVMVAPPIIFQQRYQRGGCSVDFSKEFIADIHHQAVDLKCAYPQSCSSEFLQNPEEVFHCTSRLEASAPFFGLEVTKFQGQLGYADFLESLAGNSFVSRNGSLLEVKDFIDDQTKSLKIDMMFYAPQYGITTIMQVSADMAKSREVSVTVETKDFQILEGYNLLAFLIVQGSTVFFMTVTTINTSNAMWHEYKMRKWKGFIYQTANLLVVPLLVVYIVQVFQSKVNSASVTSTTVGNLINIRWDDESTSTAEKEHQLLHGIEKILHAAETDENLSRLVFITLFMLLIRLILATSIHPRLALLTGTIARALDDLLHTTLLVSTLMLFFALVASWRFGVDHANQFGDVQMALQTQYQMLFGEFPEEWTDSPELIFYTVFYLVIMFVLVLNFILAIIVESYMSVREEIKENETEMEFWVDVLFAFTSFFKSVKYGWPHPASICARLKGMNSKISVSFENLIVPPRLGGTEVPSGCFKSAKSLAKFLKHYNQFDFLVPVLPKEPEYMSQVVEMEKRMAWLLDKTPPTYEDHLMFMSKSFVRRHKSAQVSMCGDTPRFSNLLGTKDSLRSLSLLGAKDSPTSLSRRHDTRLSKVSMSTPFESEPGGDAGGSGVGAGDHGEIAKSNQMTNCLKC